MRKPKLEEALVVGIRSIGVSELPDGTPVGCVKVVLDDGTERAILFGEMISNPLAGSFMFASSFLFNHLVEQGGDSNKAGQAMSVETVNFATPAETGLPKTLVQMMTAEGASLRFALSPETFRQFAKDVARVAKNQPLPN